MKGAEIMKVYIGYRSVMYMEGFFEKIIVKMTII